eukprot:CAMPEP_0170612668 /NCGR_PEP_ID=MMETSP0224-20130122/23848_1 /TAXON_ID=285029 /ORGANISM="Togula jolla, Strain CCCM 725" /LENGTH=509 /DNA_ID=CAMNT_0010938191 /DNA_START=109 /DNA_END=1635 /DNA_ORIENTATION=+
MSLCHGSALAEIGGTDCESIDTIDSLGLDDATISHLRVCKEVHNFNRVEVLLHLIQSLITKGLDDATLKIPPPILSRVYQTLSRGFVNLLNAKKIADTRFPFPYAQLIAILLLTHVILTPVMISNLLENKIWGFIFTFVPVFGTAWLNFVGVELENPFGNDENDLPLEHFQSEMNTCLLMLLADNADLIASISDQRCILDFDMLSKSMKGDGNVDMDQRLSHFDPQEPPELKAEIQMKNAKARWGTPNGRTTDELLGSTKSNMSKWNSSATVMSQLPQVAEHPSLPAKFGAQGTLTSEGFLEMRSVSSKWGPMPSTPSEDSPRAMSNHVKKASEVPEARGPLIEAAQSTTSTKSKQQQPDPRKEASLLAESMDKFNATLERWTRTVEAQVLELSVNFTDLKKAGKEFPGSTPWMPPGNNASHWRVAEVPDLGSLRQQKWTKVPPGGQTGSEDAPQAEAEAGPAYEAPRAPLPWIVQREVWEPLSSFVNINGAEDSPAAGRGGVAMTAGW